MQADVATDLKDQAARGGCRICGSIKVRGFRRDDVRYLVCGNCGSITKVLSRAAYDALAVSYDPGPLTDLRQPQQLRQYLDVPDKTRLLTRVFGENLRGQQLLDIGCGMGGYLLAGNDLGMRVRGVEPSVEHSQLAREILNLDVGVEYFSRDSYRGQQFDCVISSHVIEHIFDPREFIRDVMGVVAPGGKAVFITPNAASLVAKLSGSWWVMLAPVDHVSMLTEPGFLALGAGNYGEVEFQQSEHVNETLLSLAAGARQWWRRRTPTPSRPAAVSTTTQKSVFEMTLVDRLRNAPVGYPLHFLNRLMQLQACLICMITKPLSS